MKHNHLLKNILLTTSICALLTTSVLAMEQKDTSDNAPMKDKGKEEKMADGENQPHQNNQQQNPNPSVPMEDGENPLISLPGGVIGMIATHLDKKDVANMRQTDKRNKKMINSTRNSLFVQGYDEKSGVKNPSALFKAAEMGHVEARQILTRAADLYKELSTQNDPNKQLSLCMNLAKDGLFLLWSGDKQKEFIGQLYKLAKDDISGAREAFFGLSKDIAKMKEDVQIQFIRLLSGFADIDITGAREAFFKLSKDMDKIKEGGQKSFIYSFSYLAENDKAARDPFFGLSNDIFKMTAGGQGQFIDALHFLAKNNIEGARAVFLELSNRIGEMTKGVQKEFIDALYKLAFETAEKIYQELIAEEDQHQQLSLCMNLAKDGLFLFLSEDGQKEFIWGLYDLAKDDIGAREAFLELSKDMANMKEGGQIRFIAGLYNLTQKKNEDARKVFFELDSQKESMKPGVPEYYKKKLEELNKENN